MGRSSYTSNTVNYLSHAEYASSSSGCPYSAAWHAGGGDAHNKSTSSTVISSNNNTASTSSNSRPKDAPTVWAINAFDPDDETLPSIDERFLEPYEDAEGGIHFLDVRDENDDEDREYTSEEEEDDDDEFGAEDEDEDDLVDDDVAQRRDGSIQYRDLRTNTLLQDVAMMARRSAGRLTAAEFAAMPARARPSPYNTSGPRQVNAVSNMMQQEEEGQRDLPRYQAAAAAEAAVEQPPYLPGLDYITTAETAPGNTIDVGSYNEAEDDGEQDYDEPPHGNGGYYDYGYSREDEQVIDRRSTPSVVDDFSPSAGVFHRHTLPFNLPDMGEVQLQRRASGNGHSNSNSNVTVSSAVF
ncbi:hypothetical protein P389DRAFT_212901 [Cystobasidium minutum MCA 4210]|uniref:uncharacterized protein n=1 Tax=Cystobasidium minutum MCA 4210 TaxID=1397322 RepID=UPI0034CD643A|eukprot:jgi/Rhomi1/212901/estExt_Genemark1.C_80114